MRETKNQFSIHTGRLYLRGISAIHQRTGRSERQLRAPYDKRRGDKEQKHYNSIEHLYLRKKVILYGKPANFSA